MITYLKLQILIDNAYGIGILPDDIINRLGIKSSTDLADEYLLNTKKKKKRRSGSLTSKHSKFLSCSY